MTPNRIGAETYTNAQISQEGITMTNRTQSHMRSVAFKALAVGLASLMLVFVGSVSVVFGEPKHHSPGQPSHNGGIQFSTPFIIGITGLLINKVTDCATGVAIAPEKLTAEFVFADGAQPPFQFNQLKKIILKAAGYQDREITSFMAMQFSLGILVLTFIVPLEGDICLSLQPAPCNPPNIDVQPRTVNSPDGTARVLTRAGELRTLTVSASDGDPSRADDALTKLDLDRLTPLDSIPGAVWAPPVLPAKTASGTFTWTRPAGDDKVYKVRFITQDRCTGDERSITVLLEPALPDLVVEVVESRAAGGQWLVRFRVWNQGWASASTTQVQIRATRSSDSRYVEQSFGTGELASGENMEHTVLLAGGPYRGFIIVDPENKVKEIYEDNNIESFPRR